MRDASSRVDARPVGRRDTPLVGSDRRSVAGDVAAWAALAVVAAVAWRGEVIAGAGRLTLALALVVTGVGAATSLVARRAGAWAFASLVLLPASAIAVAHPLGPSVWRIAVAALGVWVVPVAVCWAHRALEIRGQRLVAVVAACALAVTIVDVTLRDPYRELYCHPICPQNGIALRHSPSIVTVAELSLLAAVVAWAVWFGRAVGRARQPGAVRVAAGLAALVALGVAGATATRRARPTAGAASSSVTASVQLLVSAAVVLTLAPLLVEVLGRRRVRRWAAELDDLARPGAALELVRHVSGDSTVALATVGALEQAEGRALTELRRTGRAIAVLDHRADAASGVQSALSPPVVTALENELLLAQAADRLGELRTSRRRLVEHSDDARRRLERDLHDGAQQRLLALGMRLAVLAERGPPERRAVLRGAVGHAEIALGELRRIAHGIIPPVLDDAGLYEAFMSLAEGSSVALDLEIASVAGRRFPAEVERACYRMVVASVSDAVGSCRMEVRATADPLVVIAHHRADDEPDRVDDEDRILAAGGVFESSWQSGVVTVEARFG